MNKKILIWILLTSVTIASMAVADILILSGTVPQKYKTKNVLVCTAPTQCKYVQKTMAL